MPERVEHLLMIGGILIGSRALLQHELFSKSDYDVAISYNNLPEHYKQMLASSKRDGFNIRNYFNKLPPLGNGWVIREFPLEDSNNKMDILIFESQSVIESMKDIISDMDKIPSYFLMDKQLRISLFERGLEVKGWSDKPDEFD